MYPAHLGVNALGDFKFRNGSIANLKLPRDFLFLKYFPMGEVTYFDSGLLRGEELGVFDSGLLRGEELGVFDSGCSSEPVDKLGMAIPLTRISFGSTIKWYMSTRIK